MCSNTCQVGELSNQKFASQMQWASERMSLESMGVPPRENSPLKKKLSIVKRLKCITAEEFPQLFAEIKTENLKKFYSEIISGLMSPMRAQEYQDIYRIVAVLRFYSGDPSFLSLLTATIKKATPSGWAQCAIYAEVHFLIYNEVESVCTMLISLAGKEVLYFIDYMLESFIDLNCSIFENVVQKETKTLTDKNIGIIQSVCRKLGWSESPELPQNYKEVIKQEKDEFIFYTRAVSGAKTTSGTTRNISRSSNSVQLADLKKLESKVGDVEFLDALGVGLAEAQGLIPKLLRKRKNRELIPSIARVLLHLKKERVELISRLTKTSPEYLSVPDVLMLCELCKFRFIRPSFLLALADTLLKKHLMESLSAIIEGAGRFLLVQRESNEGMRLLISQLTNAPLTDTETIIINDALSKLHNRSTTRLSLIDFFRWLFINFDPNNSPVFSHVSSSPRLLAILFSQPKLFPSSEFAAELIEKTEMSRKMLAFYMESIEEVLKYSRQTAFLIIDIMAALVLKASNLEQKQIIDTLHAKTIPKEIKHAMIIALLDRCDKSLHEKYVELIRSESPSLKTETLLFNFCFKHGCLPNEPDVDSFDREIECMRDI